MREIQRYTGDRNACLDIVGLIKLLADPLDFTVVVTDAQLNAPGPTILYANPAYKGMTGYAPAEVIGRNPSFLQGKRTNRVTAKQFSSKLKKGDPARTHLMNYRKNGEEYICDIAAFPICNENGEITHFIALERELKRTRGRPAKNAGLENWWEDKFPIEQVL